MDTIRVDLIRLDLTISTTGDDLVCNHQPVKKLDFPPMYFHDDESIRQIYMRVRMMVSIRETSPTCQEQVHGLGSLFTVMVLELENLLKGYTENFDGLRIIDQTKLHTLILTTSAV